MEFKKLIYLISFFILCSCSSLNIKSVETVKSLPDEVIIYWLDVHSKYFISVNCEDVKKKSLNKKRIIDKNQIKKLFNYVKNTDELKVVKTLEGKKLDSRVLIEFLSNGDIIHEVCWSYNFIEIENIVYSCDVGDCKVEEFLFSNKIINRFEED